MLRWDGVRVSSNLLMLPMYRFRGCELGLTGKAGALPWHPLVTASKVPGRFYCIIGWEGGYRRKYQSRKNMFLYTYCIFSHVNGIFIFHLTSSQLPWEIGREPILVPLTKEGLNDWLDHCCSKWQSWAWSGDLPHPSLSTLSDHPLVGIFSSKCVWHLDYKVVYVHRCTNCSPPSHEFLFCTWENWSVERLITEQVINDVEDIRSNERDTGASFPPSLIGRGTQKLGWG